MAHLTTTAPAPSGAGGCCGHLAIWREMSKIPELRHADKYVIRQEFLRRLNGRDMFGNTEPTWQETAPNIEA